MTELTPIDKRLKRQVVAKSTEFFAATAPGLEPLCLQELQALPLSRSEMAVSIGGVSFTGFLQDGYLANLRLATANRILMRVGAFKATNFRSLEKILRGFPWELYLRQGSLPHLQITTHRSRLHHSGAIAERILAAVARRWEGSPSATAVKDGGGGEQKLYLRAVDDNFTLSIDSSGENLYRRGLKKDVTAAPIRETVAAAVLMMANYTPPEPLVDPMCGAGSFSLEAAMRSRNIPAGWFREFAFSGWPAFRLTHKRWDHIRNVMQRGITENQEATIFASDIDPSACKALAVNSASADLSRAMKITTRDFFDLVPEDVSHLPGLLTMNPPFGRRIGSLRQSDHIFEKLFERMQARWGGWKFGLVIPRQRLLKTIPFPATTLPIRHAGLRLYLVTGRIPK